MLHFFSRIVDSGWYRLANAYFLTRFSRPVWFYLINRKGRAVYKKINRPLDAIQKRIVNDLRHDGIAIIHIDELFPNTSVFQKLSTYTKDIYPYADTKTAKTFLRNLWDAVPLMDFKNPFFRFAIDEKITDCVHAYIEIATKFYYFTLNVTTPITEGSEAIYSQRWHRDPEDRKLCKVFLYLNDVDEGTGPFMYVRGSQEGGKWRYWYPQVGLRGGAIPSDADVKNHIPPEDIIIGTGRSGTLIFCDTSGLHRGGYATKNERVMFTAGYCTCANAWPTRFHRADEFEHDLKGFISRPEVAYGFTPWRSRHTAYLFKKIKRNADRRLT